MYHVLPYHVCGRVRLGGRHNIRKVETINSSVHFENENILHQEGGFLSRITTKFTDIPMGLSVYLLIEDKFRNSSSSTKLLITN